MWPHDPYEGPPRVALYTRVYDPSHNSDNELFRLREYAESEQLNVVGDYCDFGSARTQHIADRPEYRTLQQHAFREERVDIILAASLNKLFTSIYEMIELVYKCRTQKQKVAIIALDDAVDTRYEEGNTFLAGMAYLKRFENIRNGHMISAGLHRARVRGIKAGLIKGGLSPSEKKLVLDIYDDYGLPAKEIAKLTGLSKEYVIPTVKSWQKRYTFTPNSVKAKAAKNKPVDKEILGRLEMLKKWDTLK
jgi:DNA invertase Pin-like site-specific DNA recombinase